LSFAVIAQEKGLPCADFWFELSARTEASFEDRRFVDLTGPHLELIAAYYY